jgi:hypothetical protein
VDAAVGLDPHDRRELGHRQVRVDERDRGARLDECDTDAWDGGRLPPPLSLAIV